MNSNTKISDKAIILTGSVILFIIYSSVGYLTFEIGRIFICIVWMVAVPALLWWLANKQDDEC